MSEDSTQRLRCRFCTWRCAAFYTRKNGRKGSGRPLLAGHLKRVHKISTSYGFSTGVANDDEVEDDE